MAKTVANEKFRFEFTINGDPAKKELGDLERLTRNLTQENKELRQEKARLKAANKQGSAEWKRVTAQIKENNTKVSEAKTRMEVLRKQIGLTGLTMAQLSKESSRLKLQLRNMTPGTDEYKKLEAQLVKVKTRMAELNGASRANQSVMSRWANGFNKYAALGAGLIATLTGVVFKMQQVIDFNGKMSESQADVMKTTGMSKEEVDDLAKSFGLLKTRTDRINLLKIAEQGGRIGIAKEDIGDFVAIMNKASVALGDEFPGGAAETAKSLGTLKGLFKETRDLGVDQAYNSIGSAINELGANGLASAPNLANFTKRVGAMPDALRPSISEALGLGAALEQSGLEAEQSARAYSIFSSTASKEVEKFAYVMGITEDQVKEMINTDPTGFFLEFSEGLKGMDATDTAKTLDYLGLNADGVKKILGAAASNTQLFRDKMQLANEAMLEGTSLIDEYNIKNNNFQATLDKVGKKIRGVFVSDTVVEFIQTSVEWFAKFIGATEDASGSTQRWRGFLLFLIKTLLIVGTAVISYTTAQKLYVLWTTRAYQQTMLWTAATKAQALALRVGAAANLLGQAAIALVTGNIKRATAAMRLFNTVTKLNPWMLLISAVAAIGVAYVAFRDNAKAARTQQELMNDAMDEAVAKTAGQVNKVKALDAVVRDETKSEEERIAAIKELNKIVPNYNENLDLSKKALQDSKLALDQYIHSLKEKAKATALNSMLEAKSRELEELKAKDLEEYKNWYESILVFSSMPGIDLGDVLASDRMLDDLKKTETEVDNLAKAIADLMTGSSEPGVDNRSPLQKKIDELRRLQKMFAEGSREYKELQNEINALLKKFKVPDPDPEPDPTKLKSYKKELEAQYFELAMQRVSFIEDASERERAIEEVEHARRIQRLRNQLVDTSKLKGQSKNEALELNKMILQRIELQERTHQQKLGVIAAKGMQDDLKAKQDLHAQEMNNLKIQQAEELALFSGSKEDKKELQEDHHQAQLALQEQHANELLQQLKSLLENESFEGVNLDLLSEEDKNVLLRRVDELKLKIAELRAAQNNQGGDDLDTDLSLDNGAANGVDLFGFTIGDWERMFNNMDTAVGKIEAVGMAIGGLTSIYAEYSNMLSAQEDREMQDFMANQERRRNALENRRSREFLTESQYSKAVQALEDETARKQAELEYEQAKRQRIIATGEVLTNTAIAASKIMAQWGFPAATPWLIALGAQSALQMAAIHSAPLPAKGYEDGLYDIIQREQDGKLFKAKNGGQARTQLVSSPTYFDTPQGRILTGENSTAASPELIVDRRTYSGFTPQFRQSLHREISRARGYEQGMYNESTTATAAPQFNESGSSSSRMEDLLSLNASFLQYLLERGVIARISDDTRDIQDLQEKLDQYNNLKKRNRV